MDDRPVSRTHRSLQVFESHNTVWRSARKQIGMVRYVSSYYCVWDSFANREIEALKVVKS